jgi:hypothetical protein
MFSPILESYLSDTARSGTTDQCLNLYCEMVDTPKGKTIGSLRSIPGKRLLTTIGTGPIRGAKLGNDGLLYMASGNQLYSVTSAYVATALGTLGSNNGPVSFINSPTQIQAVDGTGGWVWDLNALTFTQTIPEGGVSCVDPTINVYQDGFGLVNSNDNQIYQTNYNDLSTLKSAGTANNAFVQNSANDVVTLFDLKEEVWIFKANSYEIWINQGAAGFAFTPLVGVSGVVGCSAPASVAQLGESIAWLGGSDQGQNTVFMSVGYQAKPISTEALTQRIASFTTTSDAVGWGYQQGGHFFYVLTFPTQGRTFCFDLSTGKWHERASWSNGQFTRDWANCSVFFNNLNIIGDYRSGNLYALDDTVFDDAGQTRKWVRSWRILPSTVPQGTPISFDSIEIIMETGVTVLSGADPQIMLRWSDDAGYTWTPYFQMAVGKIGETAWRVIHNRLGSTKIGTGLDRVMEISGTDPVNIKILGADWQGGAA